MSLQRKKSPYTDAEGQSVSLQGVVRPGLSWNQLRFDVINELRESLSNI